MPPFALTHYDDFTGFDFLKRIKHLWHQGFQQGICTSLSSEYNDGDSISFQILLILKILIYCY